MTPTLRPYQTEMLESVARNLASGVNRILLKASTGTGKTRTFSALLTHPPIASWLSQYPQNERRMLVIAHREELLDQAAGAIRAANPELTVCVEQADRVAHQFADVVVASIQTLASRQFFRLRRLMGHMTFRVVVIDEAHHSPSRTYRTVLAHLGFLPTSVSSDDDSDIEAATVDDVEKMAALLRDWDAQAPKDRLLVGVTATPNRSDAIGLGCVFQTIAFSYGLRDAINDGWLVPISAWAIETKDSLDDVRVNRGEFNQKDLGETVNNPERNKLAVAAWRKHAAGVPTLAFTVTVQHAVDLAQCFRDQGVRAAYISGETPKEDRQGTLDAFRQGHLDVVCNCMILCLDQETEILTSSGWVGIDDMTYDHSVANWDDGRIFFEPPRFIVRRRRGADEEMVSYRSARHDFRVTGDHRMLVRGRNGWEIRHARELSGQSVDVPLCGLAEPFELPAPGEDADPTCSERRRVNSHAYELRRRGWPADTSHAEAERRIAERRQLRRKAPRELTIAECEFVGFWIGDGSVNRLQCGGREYTACQAQRYPDIIEWFDGVIRMCGFDALKRPHPGKNCAAVRWSFARGTGWGSQRRAGVYAIEPFLVKGPNPLLWGLNAEQFEGLVRGFAYADGPHAVERRSYEIGGADRELFDQLQAIAVCRGFSSTIHHAHIPKKVWHQPQSTLRIGPWQTRCVGAGRTKITTETIWRPERVWCVTSSTGNIVTRRRGHVTVTGNTEGTDLPMAGCILHAKPTKSATLYEQISGRGLRTHPKDPAGPARLEAVARGATFIKPECIIIDLVDVARKHSLQTAPVLYGLPPKVKTAGKALEELSDEWESLREEFPNVDIHALLATEALTMEQLRAQSRKVDIWRIPDLGAFGQGRSLQWLRDGEDEFRMEYPWAEGYESLAVKKDLLEHWEVVLRYRIQGQKHGTTRVIAAQVTTSDAAAGLAEAFVAQERASVVRMKAVDAKWKANPASPKQLERLRKWNIPHDPRKTTSGQASQLIDLWIQRHGRRRW